jgi:hypothetical protein
MPLSISYLKLRPIRIAVVEDYIVKNCIQSTFKRSDNSENYMNSMHTHDMRNVT